MSKTRRAPTNRGTKRCSQRRAEPVRYQIGTSGFMVSRKKWDQLHCLNCIEMNSSFYRLPSDKVISSLRENLPDGVGIVFKASKYITHTKRLSEVEEAWNSFWDSISGVGASRLKGVLFQLPPSMTLYRAGDGGSNLDRIVQLAKIVPKGLPVIFEFRHVSWLVPEVYKAFTKLGWCISGTYITKKEDNTSWIGTMPSGLYLPPRTCQYNYMRVHGSKGYKGSLSNVALKDIRKAMGKQAVSESFVFFNNTFFSNRSDFCQVEVANGSVDVNSAAVCNAVDFSNLIKA